MYILPVIKTKYIYWLLLHVADHATSYCIDDMHVILTCLGTETSIILWWYLLYNINIMITWKKQLNATTRISYMRKLNMMSCSIYNKHVTIAWCLSVSTRVEEWFAMTQTLVPGGNTRWFVPKHVSGPPILPRHHQGFPSPESRGNSISDFAGLLRAVENMAISLTGLKVFG